MFERIGKWIFKNNNHYYVLALMISSFLFSYFYAFSIFDNLQNLEQSFESCAKKTKKALEKKFIKESFVQRFENPNPYYIEEFVEQLSFLENEKKQLEQILNLPSQNDKKIYEQRVDLISRAHNRLQFVPLDHRSKGKIKEQELKTSHPVFVDDADLNCLLTALESTPSNLVEHKPQIVLTSFRLEKKDTIIGTENYEIELQILKREFLK